MKTIKFIIAFFIAITEAQYAQTGSINNTLGTGGSFSVKDGSSNFFRIDQSTGNSFILRNLEIGSLDNSTTTVGVITKNGINFLHNYNFPGHYGGNTFLGIHSGNFTLGGPNNYEGIANTGVGENSLTFLTTGSYNSAFGYQSLLSNTSGEKNSAFGCSSLQFNTTGKWNSAFGMESLSNNMSGDENTAFGYNTLQNNIASYNSAFGSVALTSNTTGGANSAFGIGSLQNNTTGSNNTAVGNIAGNGITTGSNNIAIGYNAQVPNNSGDNQVRIGNSSITYAGIQVSWSITSDRRWKKDITSSNLGLDFITKLDPVSYVRKNDESQKTEYGLIAQEVEDVLNIEGINNAGMLTKDDSGKYELRYNDLIAPIIKAIQELKNQNDELNNKYERLLSFNKQLAEKNETLAKEINSIKNSNSEQIEFRVKSILSKTQKSVDENDKLTLGN